MTVMQRLVSALSEPIYNRLLYYYISTKQGQRPKRLDLRHPQTFNEKTIWLKMNYQEPNATLLADKVRVKDFVRATIGDRYVIPSLGVYRSADAVDFSALPASFVLKANHGSGWNIICRDRSTLDVGLTRERLARWLRSNYYDLNKEPQYRDIEPRILAETYLENTLERPLVDYKVFCFSGKPVCVQVDLDRFTNHTRNFYDCDWQYLPFTTLYPLGPGNTPRPETLDEMLSVARSLSKNLVFARIDLFNYEGRVFFGEVTLHHGGGFEPFVPPEYDLILGRQLTLPRPNRRKVGSP